MPIGLGAAFPHRDPRRPTEDPDMNRHTFVAGTGAVLRAVPLVAEDSPGGHFHSDADSRTQKDFIGEELFDLVLFGWFATSLRAS